VVVAEAATAARQLQAVVVAVVAEGAGVGDGDFVMVTVMASHVTHVDGTWEPGKSTLRTLNA
jgi:hypothetical protein